MNKNFLTQVFGETDGYVYEYVGAVPEGIEPESVEMAEHVTLDFLKGHGDNLLATRVIQFPSYNHKILLYAKSSTDVNGSDEFNLITDLIPDPVVEVVEEVVETVEETVTEQPSDNTTENTDTPSEGQ